MAPLRRLRVHGPQPLGPKGTASDLQRPAAGAAVFGVCEDLVEEVRVGDLTKILLFFLSGMKCQQ